MTARGAAGTSGSARARRPSGGKARRCCPWPSERRARGRNPRRGPRGRRALSGSGVRAGPPTSRVGAWGRRAQARTGNGSRSRSSSLRIAAFMASPEVRACKSDTYTPLARRVKQPAFRGEMPCPSERRRFKRELNSKRLRERLLDGGVAEDEPCAFELSGDGAPASEQRCGAVAEERLQGEGRRRNE
jgi:hypothetical protein